MKLNDYLIERGASSALAKKSGIHPEVISMYKTGKRKVTGKDCLKIEQATNGQVTRRDLRPDDWHEIWPELAVSNE
ncbi:transcriptional regulator [Neisseria shayeganii]|uniref:Helix-turn-helix domain-containing protein n=1 Tax=Neisseria shayeganii TaxID=607712 RepID=A0A7D7N6F6_9NEIS|nr:YdaS family helix-turn-helix protein [Neisseria shayeganii]QMT41260.1 helix-turn-helix domain-containing protein [Neisseria shayeganii]